MRFNLDLRVSVFCLLASVPLLGADSGLRALADKRGFWIGSAVATRLVTTPSPDREISDVDLIARDYNVLTPETELKMNLVEPKPPAFDASGHIVLDPAQPDFNFGPADALFQFAADHRMAVHGHTLLYALNEPPWLNGCTAGAKTCTSPWSPDQLDEILKYHVQAIILHYKKAFPSVPVIWDLVNEPNYQLSVFAGGPKNGKTSVFEQIVDPSTGKGSNTYYLAKAAQYAAAADPGVRLLVNDAFAEDVDGYQARNLYLFIEQLATLGVHLYGVGFEAHFLLPSFIGSAPSPTEAMLSQTLQRFADMGLKTLISELDVALPLIGKGPSVPANQLPDSAPHYWAAQAEIYGQTMNACLGSPSCLGVITWMFNPRDSYLGSTKSWGVARYGLPKGYSSDALPFDAHNRPKPAYQAMYQALEKAGSRPQTGGYSRYVTGVHLNRESGHSYAWPGGNERVTLQDPNATVAVPITVPTAGSYQFELSACASNPDTGAADLEIDRKMRGSFTIKAPCVKGQTFYKHYMTQVDLSAGSHTVKVVHRSSQGQITVDHLFVVERPEHEFYLPVRGMTQAPSGDPFKTEVITAAGTGFQDDLLIDQPGTYEVSAIVASHQVVDTSGTALSPWGTGEIRVDGRSVGTFTTSSDAWAKTTAGTVSLDKGHHQVEVISTTPDTPGPGFINQGNLVVQSLTLKKD